LIFVPIVLVAAVCGNHSFFLQKLLSKHYHKFTLSHNYRYTNSLQLFYLKGGYQHGLNNYYVMMTVIWSIVSTGLLTAQS